MANIGSGGGTGYPSAIDTQSPPESGATLARSDVPNDLAAAVIAIETELGTNPSGSEADVKTFLQTEHDVDGSHGAITPTKIINGGDFLFSVGSSVSSASALGLGDGTIFDVTGTVNIDSIGTKGVGGYIILSFSDILTLTDDDDNLKLGGGDLITKNGTTIPLYEYAVGKWRLVGLNHSSPPKIGDGTPNTIQASSFKGAVGQDITEFDNSTLTASATKVPTNTAVLNAIGSSSVAAKAWLRYNQASPAINASFNITSITDVSPGIWDVNFTTNFFSPSYAMAGITTDAISGGPGVVTQDIGTATTGGTSRMKTTRVSNDVAADGVNFAAFFGDQ